MAQCSRGTSSMTTQTPSAVWPGRPHVSMNASVRRWTSSAFCSCVRPGNIWTVIIGMGRTLIGGQRALWELRHIHDLDALPPLGVDRVAEHDQAERAGG